MGSTGWRRQPRHHRVRLDQSAGETVFRGEWKDGRLVADGGHLLDADGLCFCRSCETAGGHCVDDDE